MKLCGDCREAVWPFVLVFFIAGFVTFLTWLTLDSTGVRPIVILSGSASAFLTVLGFLVFNVLSCMRRHCQSSHVEHEH